MDGSERLVRGGTLGGRYRLEKVIGVGGMASVWLADDEQLGRRVAVKVLSDALAADQTYVTRFEREARLAARLSHPHLVRVFDFSAGERPYLVMERIDGPTLAQVLEDDPGSVDPERLAVELLDALRHIHAAGVIHRDVKPANVLIGADGVARLTDFGIARPEDATQLTGTGEVIGTLKYMAPEVIEGHSATERSDLYSCGIVLRECLGKGAPPRLAALVDRLTAKRPGSRPASAGNALAALGALPLSPTEPTAVMAGEPDTRPTRPLAGTRRKPLIALAGLAAAALALALLLSAGDEGAPNGVSAGGSTKNPDRARAEPKQPPAQPVETQPTTTTTPPPPENGDEEKADEGPKSGKGKSEEGKKEPPGQAKKEGKGGKD